MAKVTHVNVFIIHVASLSLLPVKLYTVIFFLFSLHAQGIISYDELYIGTCIVLKFVFYTIISQPSLTPACKLTLRLNS